MAKHKNKKNSLFHSGRDEGNEKNGARLTGDSIDLTANPGEESDSDLDINELLRKYMPEYREEREADTRIDELFQETEKKAEPQPEESDTATTPRIGPSPATRMVSMPFSSFMALPSREAAQSVLPSAADATGDVL